MFIIVLSVSKSKFFLTRELIVHSGLSFIVLELSQRGLKQCCRNVLKQHQYFGGLTRIKKMLRDV
jgi:hypothetical protein